MYLLNLVQLYKYVYNSWCCTKITCTLLAHVHVLNLVRTAVDLINLVQYLKVDLHVSLHVQYSRTWYFTKFSTCILHVQVHVLVRTAVDLI